ncbi:hypothetical protein JCM11251_000763 [Rhodosporidiobolus azoricus]
MLDDVAVDPREAREAADIERALQLSLLDQGPSKAVQPHETAPCSPSECQKRSRAEADLSRSPSKRTASPPLPAGCLYLELLQYHLDFLAYNPFLDPRTGLERWQQVALGMADSEEMRTRSPILAARLFDVAFGADASRDRSSLPVPEVERCDDLFERFRHGAIRHTRTPDRGRRNEPNCIELRELIKKEGLLSMASSTFLLEWEAIAPLLPIEGSGAPSPHSRRNVPLFMARDVNADLLRCIACEKHRIRVGPKAKLKKEDGVRIAPFLAELYKRIAGPNWEATYPHAGGCSHSKCMVMRYVGFLLVVITSANTMFIDTELSDNQWFIMAFPELPEPAFKGSATHFEQTLLHHLNQLDIPSDFLDSIKNCYDFSATENKVHLVASEPDVKTGSLVEEYGVGRLASLARKLIPYKKRTKGRVELEICSGSVGTLDETWVNRVDWLLKGKDEDDLADLIEEKKDVMLDFPDWMIVFPTKTTVKGCSREVREAASNIGCSLDNKKWPTTSPSIQRMFHDYKSKDAGRLFHQKFILWHNLGDASSSPDTTAALAECGAEDLNTPFMLYLGSHNFSQAALGFVDYDKGHRALKLTDMKNYELGVVIAGKDIEGMLEKGSKWEDVVTYERPLRRYDLKGEKGEKGDSPWNSPAWVREELRELQEEDG